MRWAPGLKSERLPRVAGRIRGAFFMVIAVSAAIHAGAMLLFGSWVIYRHLFQGEARFVVPPELTKTIEPRNLKYRVQLQEQQRRGGRPRVAPRLSARRVSEFSLPDIDVEMTTVKERMASGALQGFGGSGMGSGLGGGTGAGGLGLAASTVQFFGITDRGERIMFLIDISLSMVEDDKGGEVGFERLKKEVADMIDLLNPGTFFNMALFGDKVDLFEQQMILANAENKKKAREFLDPYLKGVAESQERSGNLLGNYEPGIQGVPAVDGPSRTRMDLGVNAAFEQGADVLFLISDGRPDICKQLEGEELKKFEERREKWIKDHPNYKEEFQKLRDKENADRAKKGLPNKVIELPPGAPRPPLWQDKEILEHIARVGKSCYKEKNRPLARVNCVAYDCTTPEEETFMKMLTREFRGKFKRAKALVKPIKE